MIIATIQGENKKEETMTTLNGEFVYGDEQQRCIDKILANTKNIDNRGKQKFCSVNDNFIVFIDHPEKDDIGRIRTAMVFYNKDITKEEIYKTIEKMGLDIQNFDKLQKEYTEKKALIKGAILFAVAVGTILWLKRDL